jgi:hypothetical protein
VNIKIVALTIALLPAVASSATKVACVSSASGLTDALAALSTSAETSDADEIRIHVGTYVAPTTGWIGSVTTHHNLTIRGGYTDAACAQKTMGAALTILDGNNASGVLTINTPLQPNSDIEVSDLTFRNGRGSSSFESSAGGLKIGDPNPISGGKILVERNIFSNNSAASNGFSHAVGGLLAATDGQGLIVRGNLFVGNTSPNEAAAYLYSNNEIDVANNTFTANTATDTTQPSRVAFGYDTFAGLHLTNNIFWGNAHGSGLFDVNFSGNIFPKGATAVNNDIEAPTGVAASEKNTLHVDPHFIANDNLRLAQSPLIDAGANSPTGGLSSADLDGAPRISGSTVDLGAYETTSLDSGPAISAATSGAWYNTEQSGHGFLVQILPNHVFLAVWFAFAPDGSAQNWIYIQGPYDPASNKVTISNVLLEQGGQFPPHFDSTKISRNDWGSITFTFTGCNSADVAWNSALPGFGNGSMKLARLAGIAGLSCN